MAEQEPVPEQPVTPNASVRDSGFVGGFAPDDPGREAMPDGAAPAPEPAPASPPVRSEPTLAEVLRARREERERADREAHSATEAKKRAEAAEAENARLRGGDFLTDAVGQVKRLGWSKEDQLRVAQELLYDLAPEKATPEVRTRLLEARITRERQADEERRARQDQERAQAGASQSVQAYASGLSQAARAFAPEAYPESASWFGDDHDSYSQSLLATARNLAQAAEARGQVADLSPAAVAVVLEAEIAARMARRDGQRGTGAAAPQQQESGAQTPTTGVKPARPVSTRIAQPGGAPRPPARTEKERVQRAIEAAFGGR